jgi:hypothetical protein
VPSAIPAPPPNPKVRWTGQPNIAIPAGGLELVPGSGVVGREDTVNGKLLLDAARSDPPEEFSLFVPGVIAAGTLGVWKNTRATATATLLALEANFLTAQTTADVANFFKLIATDANGANAVLPFTTANGKHFTLNQANVNIAQPSTNAESGAATQDNGFVGYLSSFVPSQQLVIAGFRMNLGVCAFGTFTPITCRIRCTLYDTNMSPLATATVTSNQAKGDIHWSFPLSVVLTSGAKYLIGLDTFQDAPSIAAGSAASLSFSNTNGAANGAQPIGSLAATSWNASAFPGNGVPTPPADATWPDILPGGKYASGGYAVGGNTTAADRIWVVGGYRPASALVGSPGPAAFAGDVTLSIGTTGAPIGTAAGSNVNVRALLGV